MTELLIYAGLIKPNIEKGDTDPELCTSPC